MSIQIQNLQSNKIKPKNYYFSPEFTMNQLSMTQNDHKYNFVNSL